VTEPSETDKLLVKAARGVGWVVGRRVVTRLFGLVSTLALTRLLVPADFGLVAIAASFVGALDALSQVGVEDALIRAASADAATYSTAFTMNVIRGVATGLLVAVTAVPLSQFFGDPRLANVLFALAVAIACEGATNIGAVDFRRDFAFHKEFVLIMLPRLAGSVVAVSVGVIFHSYWALVAGMLTTRALKIIASYTMHPFRPFITLKAWRALVGYSLWTWAISIAFLLRDRSDSLVIGRLLGPGPVGTFSLGVEIATLPVTEFAEPLNRACFPTFSAARRIDASPAEAYLRVIGSSTLLMLPAGIGVSLVAAPLVRLAFGPQWLAAIPVVQVIGIAAALSAFGNTSMVLLGAHAVLGAIFRMVTVGMAVRVALLVVLVGKFGLLGGAIASAIGIATEQVLVTGAALRHFKVKRASFIALVWRPACATAVMAAVLIQSGFASAHAATRSGRLGMELGTTTLVGAAIYVAALGLIWLAAGRPAGAEADALGLLGRLARQSRAALLPARMSAGGRILK
jgi:lipopolysaccharide exporter